MAIRCEMTWQADKSRWRKMHGGKLYFVTCKELHVPSTKEASYQAANAWWQSKRAELDAIRPIHPHAETIAGLNRKRDWAARHGEHEERRVLSDQIGDVEALREQDEDPASSESVTILENIRIAEMFGMVIPPDLDPMVARQFFGDARIWQDRFRRDVVTPNAAADTIQGHVDRYLDSARTRHKAGNLSASEVDLIRLCLDHFSEWIGKGNMPSVINPDRWEGYWLHLLGELSKGTSVEYVKKRFRHARTFVAWLASKAIIPIPLNLHERRHRFPSVSKPIKVFTASEARGLVDRSPGQLRLHLLLMLNVGMTQKDISDLRHDEVDLKAGRIIRRRSKTRHHAHVPTVSYKLWAETFTLLQAHRTEVGDRVLTTRQGKPWVQDGLNTEGKFTKRDGINSNFRHLNPPHSLKTFRATSSTLLDGHRDYARFSQHFLGHAGRSVAERFYLNRDGAFAELFDEAVTWLGEQYGFPTV